MLLVAGAWVVGEGLKGFEHDFATAPEVPGPAELRSYRELAGDEYVEWYPIWRSIEGRPLQWDAPPGPPVSRTWMRFTDTAVADTVGDAVRQLFWMDYPGWNATIAAHPWPARFLAPNLDLSIQFHRFAPEEEWTLVDGYAPVAADGLIGCNARLWTPDGRLLATGTSTHTCRPNPQYAQELEQARARGAGE
jgi:acyl-CoA thioesterase